MYKINRLFFVIIQSILLFDSAKQSHVRQALNAVKAIGKTIKSPMFKQFGNPTKNSADILCQNKNTIKNLACGLQQKYMRTAHNIGSKSVKCLGEEGIKVFKHTAPYTARGGKQLFRSESKKTIQMRSAEQIKGKEFGSLINMISKSKPQLPLLFATGGLNKLTQFNLVSSNDDLDMKLKNEEPKDIEKVEQTEEQIKLEKKAKQVAYSKEYYLKNKARFYENGKRYRLNNKDRIQKAIKKYIVENKDKIALSKKKYYIKHSDSIREKVKEYKLKNKDYIAKKTSEYYIKNKERITEYKKNYYIKHKEKLDKISKDYFDKNKDKIRDYNGKYYAKKIEKEAQDIQRTNTENLIKQMFD